MPKSDCNEENSDDTQQTDRSTIKQQPAAAAAEEQISPAQSKDSEIESPAGSRSPAAAFSDTEVVQKAKTKARSRFSLALRKLSRSSRKKEKPNIQVPVSSNLSQEPIISSDGDELPESELSPPVKIKKKKSLFGLKKSKVVPAKECQNIQTSNAGRILEPLFQDNENEVIVTTEQLTPTEGRRKVQITIKSKKIEKVASAEQVKDKPSSPSPPPLPKTPAPTFPASTPHPTPTPKANDSFEKYKKLKAKTNTPVAQKSTTPTATATAASSPQSKSKDTKAEEKIVITQAKRDTPPRERAPAKPSRLTPTVASSSASSSSNASHRTNGSGAIRKTATTTRAAIKLVTAAKAKAAKKAAAPPTDTSNKIPKTGKGSAAPSSLASKKESDLMINPQRGHRFPRPSAGSLSASETQEAPEGQPTQTPQSAPTSTPTVALPTSSAASNKTPPATSASSPHPASSPQPQAVETQSAAAEDRNAPLDPATRPNALQSPSTDALVPKKPSQPTDDHISVAESVHPSEDAQHSKEPSPNSQSSIRFHLGTRVRPPLIAKQLAYEPSSQEPYSIELHSDDDSDSAESGDSHQRRIHYISQASFPEECKSLEQKRSHYRYQSGVSDLSLDSGENDQVKSIESLQQQMPAFGDLTMDGEMEPTIMTSSSMEKREHLYKILVIGELGTGKTSFIKRYVHQFFSQNYRATIGVDFALKVLHWDPNTIIRLQLWDIAGQERFGNMTRVYYKEAVGAFIVFDVTRSGTFECVSKWKEDLDSKVQLPDGSPIPCILLANKCDQDKQGVVTNSEKMDEYVKEHGFAGWFETSAKENINIDEAARALVNKILLNDKLISASDLADSEKFNLNSSGDQSQGDGKNKCAC